MRSRNASELDCGAISAAKPEPYGFSKAAGQRLSRA